MVDFDTIVGIDLGTTNSCVAIYINGFCKTIPNAVTTKNLTPSIVSYTPKTILVGDKARDQLRSNQNNTIINVKRLIGQKFDRVEHDLNLHSASVIPDLNGNPRIEVECMGQKKVMTPEEISADILITMKQAAEKELGYPVTKAVITVPANFNDK